MCVCVCLAHCSCLFCWASQFISLWNNHYNSIHGLTTVHSMDHFMSYTFFPVVSTLIFLFFFSRCYLLYLAHTHTLTHPNLFISIVARRRDSLMLIYSLTFRLVIRLFEFISFVGASTNSSVAKLALKLLNDWRVDLKTSFIVCLMRNFPNKFISLAACLLSLLLLCVCFFFLHCAHSTFCSV